MNEFISQILLYLTDFSKFIQQFTGGFSLPQLHYDWLIIFFFVFVIILVAVSLGRTRMLLALLSLYIAGFLESRFIWLDNLRGLAIFQNKPDFWIHIGLFFVIYFLAFAILNRSILKPRLSLAEVSVFSLFGVTVFEMGFLATVILNYFPPELLERVPPRLVTYFGTKTAQFIWAALPLLILLALKNRKPKPSQE